jgi:hypothetical protein
VAARGVSAASGTWGKAHQIPGLAALATDHASYADALSCDSPGNCSTGGSYFTSTNGSAEAFVASQTGGVWGQAEEVPGTASLNAGEGANVGSISCASAGNCSAGGGYTDRSGAGQAFVVGQVNGVWGTAVEAPGTAALNTGGGAQVSVVSCGSPGDCSAVGDYSDTSGPMDQVFAIDEVTGTWGTAQQIPGTAALNAGASAGVSSLSCSSPGNCGAGGYYADASGNRQAFVVSEVSGTWGAAIEVPGTATLNAGGGAELSTISCASAGNCSAGGSYTTSSQRQQAFVITEVNGTWGNARQVPGTGTLNAGGQASVNSVSCASAGNCSAAGGYTDKTSHIQAFVANQARGAWGKAEEVPGTATLGGGLGAQLNSLSCASPGNCSAAGSYFLPCHTIQCVDQQALVVSEVNGTWGNAIEVPGSATLNTGDNATAGPLSCTAPGKCTAVGHYITRSTQPAFVVSQT